MSIPVSLMALLLAVLFITPTIQAHGFLKTPRSRNYVHSERGGEYNPHSLNRKAGDETCGRSPSTPNYQGTNYNNWSSNTFQDTTYVSGSQIEVEVDIRVHHMGHFTLKGCSISSGVVATQACFDNNVLTFVSGEGQIVDTRYPDRAYLPRIGTPGGQANYRYRFQLPRGLSGERVLLQWHYVTANSCRPLGYSGDMTQCPNPLPSNVLEDPNSPGPAPEQVSTHILFT
jgi:hypothetical protein